MINFHVCLTYVPGLLNYLMFPSSVLMPRPARLRSFSVEIGCAWRPHLCVMVMTTVEMVVMRRNAQHPQPAPAAHMSSAATIQSVFRLCGAATEILTVAINQMSHLSVVAAGQSHRNPAVQLESSSVAAESVSTSIGSVMVMQTARTSQTRQTVVSSSIP